jgi:hypothetical protein
LFYGKSNQYTWNRLYLPYDQKYIDRDYRRVDDDGRRYRISDMRGPGGAEKGNPFYEVMGVSRFWAYSKEKMDKLISEGRVIQTRPGAVPQLKNYLDRMPGMPVQNLWDDLPVINNRSKEWLGYQTQKPVALLERIISASTNPDDLVLDPFCGCGTAIEACQKLGRRWIGIDITVLALDVVERRLRREFRFLEKGKNKNYDITGIPLGIDEAQRLFAADPHEFELWALTLVDGQPREGGKRGADGGIDGLIFFQDDAATIGQAIVSVKGGRNRSVDHVRDLIGTMHNKGAKLGVFITLHEPTSPMEKTAREAGSVEAGGRVRPKVQICTIRQLLTGERLDLPPTFDIISAAAAARRTRQTVSPPTPEQLRREPELPPMPIAGGRGRRRDQPTLPLNDPVLTQPQPGQRRRRS